MFGREAEIDRTLDVLAKRHGNCPCLVGTAGVGKTSVVRGLAQRIAEGREVAALDDRIIVEIDAAGLLAGTGVRGRAGRADRADQGGGRARPRGASSSSSTSSTPC